MTALKLALLGSPHITVGGKSIVVESRKALALLFYLAITKQRQGRDLLATLFWPEQEQSRARASLRQALWLLRNAGLEPWLVVDQDALALQGEYWCDVHLFQAAISADRIDEALALYRDDLLAGFSLRDCPEFDQWHFLHADELRRQLAHALERGVLRCSEEGEYEKGLEYARRWLALDPLHEPAHRHLMRLYAYAGQHAAALRQYEECVRLLEDELGVTPEEETNELYQAIKTRQIAPAVKARPEMSAAAKSANTPALSTAVNQISPAPHVATASSPHNNLPLHLTPFVGREAEIDELVKIIADPECRLVSIIGPGGIGKTRLAVQVARHFAEMQTTDTPVVDASKTSGPTHLSSPLFVQGVLFVPLNAVDSTNGIIAAIAEAGGFVFYNRNEETCQQLMEYLRERKMLLVLDNFEHLLASADFIVDLLRDAPNVKLLITSREALNLQGEWLWRLGGLDVPEDGVAKESLLDYSAVRMFVQNARRIQPNFSLSTEFPHVVRICRLVGGMPLAIELAVGWLRVITCEQIAREIARNLDFLTTRLRDVPQRHRSIYAVFEHSWRLLSPSEQETFQQLSIFRGGFDSAAAAQVAEASWLDLAALTEKSLLSVNSSGRYTIHELLRQYGAGKLEESAEKKEATLDRFCTYFANFLCQRESMLFGPEQLQAAADVAIELDNIRAAWQWALQHGRLEEISRSATAYYFFCQLKSRFLEGAEAMQHAQESLDAMPPSRQRDLTVAQILCHLGWLCIRLGQFEKATSVLQRSCDLYVQLDEPQNFIAGDPVVPLAIVHHIQGHFHRSLELAEEALRRAEAQSNNQNLAFIHYSLTATNLALGYYEKAHKHAEAASDATRAARNRWFLPYILNESGKLSRAEGNYAEAKSLFQESYEIKREHNDPEGMAVALNHLGEIAYLQSDYEKAQHFYADAFEIYSEINDRGGLAASSRGLGQVACAKGQLQAANHWFEQALKIALEIRFWPLLYSLLLDVSHLFMRTGAEVLAIEALALVQKQPGSDYETRQRASQLLHQWQSRLPKERFEAAVQLGSAGDAEALLERILAEISAAA
jgi:predicted ATPase/DNA-binding SARP family transcriptional activator